MGRLTARDYQREQVGRQHVPPLHEEVISGVLLRSAVVSGLLGLLVDGYADSQGKALPLWRFERLARMYCCACFRENCNNWTFIKRLSCCILGSTMSRRPVPVCAKPCGMPMASCCQSIPLEGDATTTSLYRVQSKRVLNMEELYKQIAGLWSGGEFTPAQFAMVMTEGIERVRFVAG
ncbi:MAG: hypothetical protein HZT40_09000 [Candidatus Thiothrix singaporensis]|uniref:Uncharacterized protein n=1 Tax=Candidatus Thiothrix singaporensis TaxID=2799669 RepID=A0A7L6ARW3_9GAMM|nr:MAG: hypothetical protein HZT40_09000 [Candidatus Thiothrix singaporensis]